MIDIETTIRNDGMEILITGISVAGKSLMRSNFKGKESVQVSESLGNDVFIPFARKRGMIIKENGEESK